MPDISVRPPSWARKGEVYKSSITVNSEKGMKGGEKAVLDSNCYHRRKHSIRPTEEKLS